jgi:hypothetical protein
MFCPDVLQYVKCCTQMCRHNYCFLQFTYVSYFLYSDLFDTALCGSQDSLVGVVTRVRAERLRNQASIPGRGTRFFSPTQHPDRPWGPVGTGHSFFGDVKLSTHLRLVRRAWGYTSTAPYVCMARCVINHEDNLTFTALVMSSTQSWCWLFVTLVFFCVVLTIKILCSLQGFLLPVLILAFL